MDDYKPVLKYDIMLDTANPVQWTRDLDSGIGTCS